MVLKAKLSLHIPNLTTSALNFKPFIFLKGEKHLNITQHTTLPFTRILNQRLRLLLNLIGNKPISIFINYISGNDFYKNNLAFSPFNF